MSISVLYRKKNRYTIFDLLSVFMKYSIKKAIQKFNFNYYFSLGLTHDKL